MTHACRTASARTICAGLLTALLLAGLVLISLPLHVQADDSPTPTYIIQGTYTPPAEPPAVEIPPSVPLLETSDDIINILLLGSDSYDRALRRTDVLILVSINREAGTAAMWHIPRDLFVYIPDHTMDRINTAYATGGPNGGGFTLLQETFRYNFGIELDHYARVNFTGFQEIINRLGGLVISVDCALQDWKLIDPALDPSLEESWEMFTLPVGRQTLDAYTALWYARSRVSTSDLDRGRRQMDILRAIWQQARDQGLLTQVTDLWPQLVSIIETDMDLDDALELAPLALSMDMGSVARYSGSVEEGGEYKRIYTPDNGRDVLLPNHDALLPMLRNFLLPATPNRLARHSAHVEIMDAAWYGYDFIRVAADRLAWEGFSPAFASDLGPVRRDWTVIYDYTGQSKGSPLPELQRLLRVADEQVIREPDPNRIVDYRVELGAMYNSCIYASAEDSAPPTE